MYRHPVKLGFKSFLSALLGLLLLVVPLCAQTTQPIYSRWPVINRATSNRAGGVINATTTNPRRPTIRDMIFGEELLARSGENVRRGIGNAKGFAQKKVNPTRDSLPTIPHWSDSFTYHGLTYKQTMVGTDPRRGSATTIIPTVIIPLRIIFDGVVSDPSTDLFDGENPIEEILNSPVFKPTQINIGGVSMGNTQYGDAFQRANFWNSVSRNSPDYHVLLGQPTVLPAYEVHWTFNSFSFRDATIAAVRQANLPAGTLAIVLAAPTWKMETIYDHGGIHGAYDGPSGVQTYIGAFYGRQPWVFSDPDCQFEWICPSRPDYHPSLRVGAFDLSKAVLDWMNNPFLDSATPGYSSPLGTTSDASNCDPSAWVAHMMEQGSLFRRYPGGEIDIAANNLNHRMPAGAFRDYFTRAPVSRSVNGLYTTAKYLPGVSADGSSPPCVGTLDLDKTVVEFPDSYWTRTSGINNKGWIVGDFYDWSMRQHGYIFDGMQYTQIDYPGARRTVATGINDAGQVVGIYFNASGRPPRGFLYHQGRFTPVDFPGASDTYPRGINNAGQIVGMYDALQETTHGFMYEQGEYRTLDTPFGLQTDPAAINDRGEIVGMAWDENGFWPTIAFRYDSSGFGLIPRLTGEESSFMNYPRAVNNLGMLAGVGDAGGIYDPRQDIAYYAFGFVTIYGYPYGVTGDGVNGMNDKGQIVGNDFDDETQRYTGFVATLPN